MTTKKLYVLTDEHRAQLKPWAQRWIANAMSTKPMDDDDRAKCVEAVYGMYEAAGLKRPRVVFVPSPFVARFAAGFAAAIWHVRKCRGTGTGGATLHATRDATAAATRDATAAAALRATQDSTSDATSDAPWGEVLGSTLRATSDATLDATLNSTLNATSSATQATTSDTTWSEASDETLSATFHATREATSGATRDATAAASRDAEYATRAVAETAARLDVNLVVSRSAASKVSLGTTTVTCSATGLATDPATSEALDEAVSGVVNTATEQETYAATRADTLSGVDVATELSARFVYAVNPNVVQYSSQDVFYSALSATNDATGAAAKASLSEWWVMPGDMRALADQIGVGSFGIQCASRASDMWQGGNQWSSYDSFLSFFRHVAKLDIDYSKWQHWETLSLHSGPRFVHEEFCIISDRPRVLKVDPQNRPHCEDGPFCAWSDGCELYSWHGARVPADWIVNRKTLDPKIALTHENVELRRAAAEIVGWAKVLECVSARVVDEDKDPEIGVLLEADIPDSPGARFLKVRCGTGRTFVLPVPGGMKTALDANSWTYGIDAKELLKLEART